MNWIKSIVVIAFAASLQRTFPSPAVKRCSANFCSTVTCKKISASDCNGKVEANSSDCGCCEACVMQLEEGEVCFSFAQYGVRKWGECKEGLRCNEAASRCEKKPRIPTMLYND
ncbi:uncharacterized protein LOC142774791 [Rhipicephalus microplus]|uniref:uncharacterized protein LOC142774791 n=1 Tax=Rhipicephalus microplus TaxID=6941 RepID=UPI003F6A561F